MAEVAARLPASRMVPSRMVQGDAFGKMLGVSSLVHVAGLTVLMMVPGLLGTRSADQSREVMTISLGGAPGPRAGGMTPMGGRPVQQAVPQPTPRPEPVRPPAAKAPEMIVPTKDAKRAPRGAAVKTAPEEARTTLPTHGPREQLGSTIAETGGKGVGLGLSTGGGGTGGEIDLANFCCPEYLSTMLQLIQRNWDEKQQVGGVAVARFSIRRTGIISDITIVRPSGYTALDLAAERALRLTQLPPLPAAYTNPVLTINLNFQYQH